jgi:hypothetical protein
MKLLDPVDPSGGAAGGLEACACVCTCGCGCESEGAVEDSLIVSHESGDTIADWVGNWIPIIT